MNWIEEFDSLTREPKEVTLPSGVTVTLKRLSWGQELKIYKTMCEIFHVKNPKEVSDEEAYSLLISTPDSLTKIASIALNKDLKWVEENLTMKDLLELVLPLSVNILRRINEGMADSFKALTPEREK